MSEKPASEETLAFMDILEIGRKEIENGEHELAEEYFARVRVQLGLTR